MVAMVFSVSINAVDALRCRSYIQPCTSAIQTSDFKHPLQKHIPPFTDNSAAYNLTSVSPSTFALNTYFCASVVEIDLSIKS